MPWISYRAMGQEYYGWFPYRHMLAVQPRAFVLTTNSQHEFEVYLNLASHLKLTGINQLWGGLILLIFGCF